MNLSMMLNEMEIYFRVFFTSSCGFLVGLKGLWRDCGGSFFQTLRSCGMTDRRR